MSTNETLVRYCTKCGTRFHTTLSECQKDDCDGVLVQQTGIGAFTNE